jgi:hypothetical protein
LKYQNSAEIRSNVAPSHNSKCEVYQSPLIRTLQLLSREEMEVLRSFVSSPIFNDVRPEETSSLFEYLRQHYPRFDAPEIDREVAAHHFFPNAANPVGSLQRTMTQLMNVVRKFVAFRYTQLRDARANNNDKVSLHDIQHKLALMRLYNERLHQITLPSGADKQTPMPRETGYRKGRKAENFFLNLNNQVRSALNEQQDLSGFDEYGFMDFMYFRFMAEHEKVLYETTSSLEEGDNNLLAATERLDSFYLTAKLEHVCQLLHYGRRLALFEADTPEYARYEANIRFTIQLVHTIRQTGLSVDPGVDLYCTFLEFFTENDPTIADQRLESFEQLLEQNSAMLPKSRMETLGILLRSFWPARYRETRDRRFMEKLHNRQRRQLVQVKPGENIATSFYQNTLFSGLKLGFTDWCAGFVDEYSGRLRGLDTAQTAILVEITRAAVDAYQGSFREAASKLPHYLNYGICEDIYLYAIAATLDVRIHYELGDLVEDYGTAMIHATTTRIRREESLPKHRREERLQFFSIAKELYKIQEQLQMNKKANVSAALKRIRMRLDQETVVDWEWLEEKLKSLKEQTTEPWG